MQMLSFNSGSTSLAYQHILYVYDTALVNALSAVNRPTRRHKNQGFTWEPSSIGFFVHADAADYHVECYLENEIPYDNNALRTIQLPFTVGDQGVSLQMLWLKDSQLLTFHVPAGEYALIFETGYQDTEKRQLCSEVMEEFTRELENDPLVQDYYNQQHNKARERYESMVASLFAANPLASRQDIEAAIPDDIWSYPIIPLPDYDQRLQCWLKNNREKIFQLSGGDGYENDNLKRWIRLWFKPEVNAEPKILVQDTQLRPAESLDLGDSPSQALSHTLQKLPLTSYVSDILGVSFDIKMPYYHDSFYIYDPSVVNNNFQNDDAGIDRQQGFSWRTGSIALLIATHIKQYRKAPLHVGIILSSDEIPLLTDSIRAIQLPFTVGDQGIVLDFLTVTEWYYKPQRKIAIPAGHYRLTFELGYQDNTLPTDEMSRPTPKRCRLWFKPETHVEAKILVQDSALNPCFPLRLDAKPYEVAWPDDEAIQM